MLFLILWLLLGAVSLAQDVRSHVKMRPGMIAAAVIVHLMFGAFAVVFALLVTLALRQRKNRTQEERRCST